MTSEDHSPNMVCYGDKLARTPNVDALAAKGTIFQHAWSCCMMNRAINSATSL